MGHRQDKFGVAGDADADTEALPDTVAAAADAPPDDADTGCDRRDAVADGKPPLNTELAARSSQAPLVKEEDAGRAAVLRGYDLVGRGQ